MRTEFRAEYDLIDITAATDADESTSSNQSFGDISALSEGITSGDYGTLETDYFLLDGSYPELPDAPADQVFFSSVQSGSTGAFVTDPQIMIEFDNNHTSAGLTFHFIGDHPLEMTIIWYTLDNIPIATKSFEIDSNDYFASNQVENYGKIVITFTKAEPYRNVKLRYLEYGLHLIIGESGLQVSSASLVEEANPISDKIAINKLDMSVLDEQDTFNVGNIAGLHKVLQSGQKCAAYETVDGTDQLLGKFYLNTYKTDDNVTKMTCQDIKGLLDNFTFRQGAVYDGTTTAGVVLDQVMTAAGITNYSVAADVRSIPLFGWLKNQSCRKVLREILFACGAVADTSRDDKINIFLPDRIIRSNVKRSRKFSTSVSTNEYISDVTIKYSNYNLASAASQILKGEYQPGTYTVDLQSPASDMTATGATITAQTNNYVTFTVATAGEVVISGKKYTKEDVSVTASIEHIAGGAVRKTKSFTCTCLDGERALQRAQAILDYYQLQLGLKISCLNEGEAPTKWALVDNTDQEYVNYVAGAEKVSTDLTGGFVSNVEMRGYYDVNAAYDYMPEIYGNDGIGDL
ncbi:MAG: hypothetical protein E7300_01035 [Lachnospiraceae bacterium]|nr:hypothetical protein [Lachnospiraceae bacterium]